MCCCSGARRSGEDAEARPRQRVADRDQVARVPVAAGEHQRPRATRDAVVPAPPAAARSRSRRRSSASTGASMLSLTPTASPAATAASTSRRRRGRRRRARTRPTRAGRTRRRRRWPAPPACEVFIIGVAISSATPSTARGAGAPRAVRCTTPRTASSRATARFSDRRQGVVAQQHDPEAVQHLGGGRIERRQVLDVGEPQRA